MKILKNHDKIKKSIVENLLVTLIMALYIVYGIHYLPLLMIFIPIPFVVLGIRNGIRSNIISMVITSLIIGMVLGMPGDIIIIIMFAPLSIVLNYLIKERKKTGEIVILSAVAFFLSLLIITSIGNKVMEIDVAKESERFLTQIITVQTEAFEEMGMTKYQIFENINLLESVYEYILITLPSIYMIMSLILSYINYIFINNIVRKMGYEMLGIPRLSKFKLPNNIIIGTGLMILTAIIMGKLEIPYHNALLLNISSLVGFIFFLQGLALLDFLLIKLKMKPIFRIIILFFNIINIYMSGILFFAGIIDSIFDIRKIGRRKSL